MTPLTAAAPWHSRARLGRLGACFGICCSLLLADSGAERPRAKDLSQSSLEELMDIEVTSVSRKDQRLSQSAAAVFVITQDDIRRSGATSIPEALRLAPGVQVARIDSNSWAVTARGFNGRFANKMQVLIDGRSVYTNLYSGVYWDQNDVMLEDVERIEVIRGPGATMWGANAVNGVINVITKTARNTQGTLVSAGTGSDDLASAAVRYGGHAGEKVHYRVFGKSFKRSASAGEAGSDAYDGWSQTRLGGRLEWEISERDSLTVHGDGYSERADQVFSTDFPSLGLGTLVRDRLSAQGGYGLARWTRKLSGRSDFAAQAYVNQETRDEGMGFGSFRTLDLDFQHRFAAGRHDITWGTGYRRVSDHIIGKIGSFEPARRSDYVGSGFLQDDFALIENRLTLTAGSKFQYNDYSGFEWQPNVRLLWTPGRQQSFWAALSRAVRTPSRRDRDLVMRFPLPSEGGFRIVGDLLGSRAFESETARAWEAGARRQVGTHFALDVAAFYNQYGKLQLWKMEDPVFEFPAAGPLLAIPLLVANGPGVNGEGVETAVTWNILPRWKLTGTHTWIRYRFPVNVAANGFTDDNAPRHQWHVRSSMDLSRRASLDVMAYSVAAIEPLSVPSYTRLDVHLGYRIGDRFGIGLGGRNLLDARHPEFVPEDFVLRSQVRRSAWVKATWTF